MKELFSPSNMIWIIPLGLFGLLIILGTCYFLRREIASFFQKMFFPDTNRYSIPAGIISNVNTAKTEGPFTPEQLDAMYLAAIAIPTESTGTIITPSEVKPASKEATTKEVSKKKENTVFRHFETNLRLHFRNLRHAVRVWFAEFAGTEDSPSNAGKTQPESAKPEVAPIPQTILPAKPEIQEPAETVKVMAEKVREEAPKAKEVKVSVQEPKEESKSEIKEEVEVKAEPIKEIKEKSVHQKDIPVYNVSTAPTKAGKKHFLSDRTALIVVLLILVCFTIFLSAKVKLLGSLAMRNRVEIQNLNKQIEMIRYEQRGYKIVIHNRTTISQKRYNK